MLPLYARFPALRSLPRAELATLPSPVQRVRLPDGTELWVKRDDLDAPDHGGNKVRALEFLLGAVRPGDTVLTLGGRGSTHVLATAAHARRLGARTTALRWPHECSPTALAVAREAERLCDRVVPTWSAVGAIVRVAVARFADAVAPGRRARGGARRHVIPVGGSEPLGVLGHVNAALELAAQIAAGELPMPRRVVLPLGSAGTTAGLALGFAAAGLDVEVVGVRVVPRIAGSRRRVLRLADATARLIEGVSRSTNERANGPGGDSAPTVVPRVRPEHVRVEHSFYGGAYGRELPAGAQATALLHDATAGGALPPLTLDPTYGAKAAAAAIALAAHESGPTLFWATFDGRWMER